MMGTEVTTTADLFIVHLLQFRVCISCDQISQLSTHWHSPLFTYCLWLILTDLCLVIKNKSVHVLE